MPTNKHASIRYQALDKCFRNPGRRYYINDLIEACNCALDEFSGIAEGVKRRQIFDDIRFMKSEQGWNIPLEHIRDGKKVYYRYEDMGFSINNQPLNETELNQLRETLFVLSRFKGMPQFLWINEISTHLQSGLGLAMNSQQIIEFDHNDFLMGLEFITPLFNAILYRRVLLIDYKSFKLDTLQTFVFHPYYLKQYKNRWFVFGLNQKLKVIINLALDRIIAIDACNQQYIPNTINFSEYLEDIIGVTLYKDARPEKILLRIDPETFPYILTKPLHSSQIIKKSKGKCVVEINVIPNYELESLILSYGEALEVLAPENLRNKLAERIKLLIKKYD